MVVALRMHVVIAGYHYLDCCVKKYYHPGSKVKNTHFGTVR